MSITDWRDIKDEGREAFGRADYNEALRCYLASIDQLTSQSDERNIDEHQVLLSNVVACRLKLGGKVQVEKAVEDAEKCISLNDRWPKAHVRLASAYIALGGHSNDACRALQRALSLDRNNVVAREMLVKEMQQRNSRESGGVGECSNANNAEPNSERPQPGDPQSSSQHDNHPTAEAPAEHLFPGASAPPEGTPGEPTSTDGINLDDIEPPSPSMSITERINYHLAQFSEWFHSLEEDKRTLLKVVGVFLLLYVALGGRFGLEYALGGDKVGRGNYARGNAYDRYASGSHSQHYNDDHTRYPGNSGPYSDEANRGTHTSSGFNDRSQPQNERHYSRNHNENDDGGRHSQNYGRQHSRYEDESYYQPRQRRTSRTSPNLFDGSSTSMVLMLGIGFICHRFGVNPFQVFAMLRMAQGGNRYGYGGFRGGFGGGFGRPRYGRARGRW